MTLRARTHFLLNFLFVCRRGGEGGSRHFYPCSPSLPSETPPANRGTRPHPLHPQIPGEKRSFRGGVLRGSQGGLGGLGGLRRLRGSQGGPGDSRGSHLPLLHFPAPRNFLLQRRDGCPGGGGPHPGAAAHSTHAAFFKKYGNYSGGQGAGRLTFLLSFVLLIER